MMVEPKNNQSKANLLIVDADTRVRSVLASALRGHGFAVAESSTGKEACERLVQTTYDLVVLDPTLLDMNGIDIIRCARKAQQNLAIVVLTGNATIESAIAAVKFGASDYMLKPCQPDDLLSSVSRALEERAQQVRHQRLLEMVSEAMDVLNESEPPPSLPGPRPAQAAPAQNIVQVGIVGLDRQKRLVTVNTLPPRTAELTDGEMAILLTLMEKPNQVFSYIQLAEKALGYVGVDKWTAENMVRSSVFRLRQKVEPGGDAPHLIRTVRGRGYYFAPS